jgi:hypothetical protein
MHKSSEIEPRMLALLAAVAFGGVGTLFLILTMMWRHTNW